MHPAWKALSCSLGSTAMPPRSAVSTRVSQPCMKQLPRDVPKSTPRESWQLLATPRHVMGQLCQVGSSLQGPWCGAQHLPATSFYPLHLTEGGATPEIRFKEDLGSVMHRLRGGKLFCLHAEGFPRDVIQHRGCCRGAFLQNTLPFPSKYCQHGAARCARGCLDLKSFHPSLVQSQGRAAEICSEIGPRRCLCIRKRDREP